MIIDGEIVHLQVWDTAGQERYKSLGFSFYRGADCVLLVYDVTSPASYHSIQSWKEEFLAISDPKDPETFPFVVVGNKIDLRKDTSCPNKIQDLMACDYEVPCFEVSALDGTGVELAFRKAAKMAMEKDFEERFFEIIPEVTCHNTNGRSKCYC
ncbi:ras-related protein Rab-7a-like [Uloborus diversus]|uniref:ras-related protein Rab-7a-like n=1 Tax=Uloborus diversus TaxID=327109 RepID=UPI0024098D43|nr:ras-related protein Rab-7a-like [Uloborus diversus]